jgi:hypothetical protein
MNSVASLWTADVSSVDATQSLAFTEHRSVSTRVASCYLAKGDCMEHFLFARWLYCIHWIKKWGSAIQNRVDKSMFL